MDAALKESWKDVLQRLIFTPLGMTSTTAYLSRADRGRLAMPYRAEEKGFSRLPYAKTDGNMHAAGGLVASVEDLAKWLEVNINRGRLDGRQIFPAAVMGEVHRKQVSHTDTFRNYQRFGYGLGWQFAVFGGDTLVHHFGGFPGFTAHISFMPRHRLGVAVLANETGLGGALTDLVAQTIYDKLRGKPGADKGVADTVRWAGEQAAAQRKRIGEDRARRAARPQTLPFPLEAYSGVFENRLYGRGEWRVVNGKLEARIGALQSTAEVFDGTANALRVELIPGQGGVIRFAMENGRAKSFDYGGVTFSRVGR